MYAHHFKLLTCIQHKILVNVPNLLYYLLCISAKETQRGNVNSITQHALIKLLVEKSLRDSSPISWEEFVKFKTLQHHINPILQNLGNTEETTKQSQNQAKLEKEATSPSLDKPAEPILEGNVLNSSMGKGKRKVVKEIPNLEK